MLRPHIRILRGGWGRVGHNIMFSLKIRKIISETAIAAMHGPHSLVRFGPGYEGRA